VAGTGVPGDGLGLDGAERQAAGPAKPAGVVVTLASQLASKSADSRGAGKLREYVGVLERSRLVKEDTLCQDSLTEAERKWLRSNRPAEAAHWNLLTDMKAENLPHATL